MGPFNVTITVRVRGKKFCHLTITVLSRILSQILSRCCYKVVTEHIEHPWCGAPSEWGVEPALSTIICDNWFCANSSHFPLHFVTSFVWGGSQQNDFLLELQDWGRVGQISAGAAGTEKGKICLFKTYVVCSAEYWIIWNTLLYSCNVQIIGKSGNLGLSFGNDHLKTSFSPTP